MDESFDCNRHGFGAIPPPVPFSLCASDGAEKHFPERLRGFFFPRLCEDTIWHNVESRPKKRARAIFGQRFGAVTWLLTARGLPLAVSRPLPSSNPHEYHLLMVPPKCYRVLSLAQAEPMRNGWLLDLDPVTEEFY